MDGISAGGSRRKRSRCRHPPVEEEDADDESKVDRFFDLIHNLGQSLRSHGGWVAIANNNGNKRIKRGWEPRFELQDFATDHGVAAVGFNDGTAPPPSDLDLSLSL